MLGISFYIGVLLTIVVTEQHGGEAVPSSRMNQVIYNMYKLPCAPQSMSLAVVIVAHDAPACSSHLCIHPLVPL